MVARLSQPDNRHPAVGGDGRFTTHWQRWFTQLFAIAEPLGRGELPLTVYDDYTVSGLALGLGASAPSLKTFRDGIKLFAFSGTGPTEEGFFTIHLLHGLKAGTAPTFHVHSAHIIGAPTGNIKWQIEYSIARGYGVTAYPASTTLSTTRTALAQYVHDISDDDDMPIALNDDVEPDAVIVGRIFRESGDKGTFANDAFLIQVDMHYQRKWLGTQERNRPFTSSGF